MWEWTDDMTGVMLTHYGLNCIKDSRALSSMFGRKIFLAGVDRYFFLFLNPVIYNLNKSLALPLLEAEENMFLN